MKILVVLSRIPWPLEKGDKLRAYNQIKCLAENNDIYICALQDNSTSIKEAEKQLSNYYKSLKVIHLPKLSILWNMGLAWLKGLPIQCGYFYNRKAHQELHEWIQAIQPDILYGQFVRVAPYLLHENAPKIIDYQDVLSYGIKRRMDKAPFYEKPIFHMEYKRLVRYEREVLDNCNLTTIISDSDRQLIEHQKRNDIVIVPNGVDFNWYAPQHKPKQFDIIFSGNMAYPPNIDAVQYLAKEIMPIVWKSIPYAKLCIAGATPSEQVKTVASKNIIVTGWVDDMREMYAQSRVFIAPMRIGTGLQNKLLEAMSMQLPCITTPLANGALRAKHESEILVGHSAEELARHIIHLLQNASYANDIARNGNQFVKAQYDWKATTKILEEAMQKIIK